MNENLNKSHPGIKYEQAIKNEESIKVSKLQIFIL